MKKKVYMLFYQNNSINVVKDNLRHFDPGVIVYYVNCNDFYHKQYFVITTLSNEVLSRIDKISGVVEAENTIRRVLQHVSPDNNS